MSAADGRTAGIDGWLPRFDVGERHQVAVATTPERALVAALAVPAAPDRFVRWLFRTRGLAPDGSIDEFMAANRFTTLERTATTWVVGLVARGFRPLPLDGPEAWRRASAPRSVRIAADFRAEPRPGGSLLVTETRVAASDRAARLGFRLYWLAVGPFSRLIRRRWLRAAARACAAAGGRAASDRGPERSRVRPADGECPR